MSRPVVSIIIPTYNRAHLIEETLASVAAQTLSDYEILVIDDGSKDNTDAVMRSACAKDSRIRYVRQPNGGVSTARNHGLRLAEGEFIAFLDSDDLWLPWKLELQVKLMRALPQVGMLWTNMDAIDEQGKPLSSNYLRTMYSSYNGHGPEYPFQSTSTLRSITGLKSSDIPAEVSPDTIIRMGQILREMVFGNLVHTSTVLIRQSIANRVGPFDETMRRAGEDFDYHLRTCSLTEVAYLEKSSMLYRIGMKDQITSPENNLYFARSFLVSVRPFLNVPGLLSRAEQRQILASSYQWTGEQLLDQNRVEAIMCLLKSAYYQPTEFETLKLLLKGFLPLRMLRKVRDSIRHVGSKVPIESGIQAAKN